MSSLLVLIVAFSLGAVLYSYALYPLLLMAVAALVQLRSDLGRVLGKGERRAAPLTELPSVSVLISAFNEEACIAARIDNLLALDYPRERLQILIGSDGSRDRTGELMRAAQERHADAPLQCLVFEQNRGKANVLNDLAARAEGELLVFSDANTQFAPDALRQLAAPFADARVGGVSGELRLHGAGGDNQDGVYWRIEQLLKFFENRIGGLLGANGAIYGIRRALWKPLAADTICDDFLVAMNVAAAGYRLRYVPAAWAAEEMPARIAEEYRRRVRIGIGNFQALFRHPEYLLRTGIATAFTYVSHKVLRWLAPHLLILALLASALLATRSSLWLIFTLLQLVAYALAAACWRHSARGGELPAPLRIPAFLFALNWAFLVASLRFARGRFAATWASTPR
ncbi:MAG: glycosyltransferase family 2 protein [Aquimonas sp.]|jgi:cellulose synthase/poly-beta-1,6-N-acetylglucosamine synthase-like glycosyltransferase